jgi:hypothetical protein
MQRRTQRVLLLRRHRLLLMLLLPRRGPLRPALLLQGSIRLQQLLQLLL